MAKTKERANPILLRQGMRVGSVSAETDDDYLFDCFVTYHPVGVCLDANSHGMVLTGRTGSGKTAIIRYISSNSEHNVQIDPSEMAMNYISNSDCLTFLSAMGADLDLIFQYLWKHVLCIEFIRLRWDVKDESASKSIFMRLLETFSGEDKRKKALSYLREWEGKFWITMDQNIKEITEKIDDNIKAELGLELHAFKTNVNYVTNLSEEKKSDILYRSKNIVKPGQLAELSGVIDLLSEHAVDPQNKFYILIDKLDERWVEVSIRFRLIRSLLETLKTFRRIKNLKIIVALRADVLERVIQETKDMTFQREKYDDYFVKIRWTKILLRELIEKRVNAMFRRQYTGKVISFADLFPNKVGNIDPFDYMLEKTLYRPRDIIAFVNECLEIARDHYEVTSHQVRRAEVEFSRIRRESLEQEWESAFPTLHLLLNYIASRGRESFSVKELCEDDMLQLFTMELATSQDLARDPVAKAALNYINNSDQNAMLSFVREMLATLYRVGVLGVKFQNSDKYRYSHINEPMIHGTTIAESAQARVHPMLHSTLKLNARATL